MLQYVSTPKNLGRPATYEDLLEVPDHLVAEIIDGELYTSPRPAPRHAVAESTLAAELIAPFQKGQGGPGGWWIITEPELHLGPDVLVPDCAGWHRQRMPELPETAYFPLAPDWVCEVLSPSTARMDRAKKLRIYARERVAHAWLLDPIARTLEILSRNGKTWMIQATYSAEDCVRAAPFDAIEIALPYLWGETPAPVQRWILQDAPTKPYGP